MVSQLKAREDAIAAAKLKLVQDMIVEDERVRKVETKERHHVEAMREYQASLSRSVKEAKVSDYISSRTKSGQDVLDPSGRTFTIQPSQVTTIKDHSFGLGKAPSDLLEKVCYQLHLHCVGL